MRGGGLDGIDKKQAAIYAVAMLLCFLCYYFCDINITTRHGINVWNALFSGNILHFYTYNLHVKNTFMQTVSECPAAYGFPLYLAFALWDLPLFIIEKVAHISYSDFPLLVIYSKGILIVAFIACIAVFKKICLQLGYTNGRANECVFFWMTSAFVIEPLFVNCHYDILSLYFILLGFYAYLRGDNKKFVMWFGISCVFKHSLGLMLFLPLLVYREKKVIKVLLSIAAALIPALLLKLLFMSDAEGNAVRSEFVIANMKHILDWCMRQNGALGEQILLFVVGWVAFLVYVYTSEENKKQIVPISVIAFWLFFGMCYFQPHWIILVSPFAALLVFQSSSTKISAILETITAASITMYLFYRNYFFYNAEVLKYTVMKNMRLISLTDILPGDVLAKRVLYSVYFTCFVLFIVYGCRKEQKNITLFSEQHDDKIVSWIRLGINLFLCLLQIALPIVGAILT